MPMLRAVPSMIRIAESIESVLRSTSLVCAMSRTCCRVTLPILSLCGTAEAFAIPAALGGHVVHHGLEVDERSVDDAHLVAALEHGLGLGLLGARLHLTEDVVDLIVRQRDRLRPGPDEPGDLRRRTHEMPRVVRQL